MEDYKVRELLRVVLDLHAYYGDPNIWLWGGQAVAKYDLTPALHSRLEHDRLALDDAEVMTQTRRFIEDVRRAHLDVQGGIALPDMALLAMLQHHGAATPLLDVSLDPLVALYMAVVSPSSDDDKEDGVLVAIKKPGAGAGRSVAAFDSRSFETIYGSLRSGTHFYSAPDVSERLRIQRGHFLIGRVTPRHHTTLDLEMKASAVDDTWLSSRMAKRGKADPSPARLQTSPHSGSLPR